LEDDDAFDQPDLNGEYRQAVECLESDPYKAGPAFDAVIHVRLISSEDPVAGMAGFACAALFGLAL
jgi:hypothetical protein